MSGVIFEYNTEILDLLWRSWKAKSSRGDPDHCLLRLPPSPTHSGALGSLSSTPITLLTLKGVHVSISFSHVVNTPRNCFKKNRFPLSHGSVANVPILLLLTLLIILFLKFKCKHAEQRTYSHSHTHTHTHRDVTSRNQNYLAGCFWNNEINYKMEFTLSCSWKLHMAILMSLKDARQDKPHRPKVWCGHSHFLR